MGDIELVAIPRTNDDGAHDLFGQIDSGLVQNELWGKLDAMRDARDIEYVKAGDQYRQFRYRPPLSADAGLPVFVDLFTANPDTFGWIHLIRTGSAEFSHRMARLLNRAGYTSEAGAVRRMADRHAVATPDEETVFKLAGISYLPPKERTG